MDAASLTEWRKRLGLKRTEAAKTLGMSRTTYERYESGKAKKIPLYVALACKAILLGEPPIK